MANSASPNQLAFEAVEAILGGAHPFTLSVAGTPVAIAVSHSPAAPWPAEGFDGVAPRATMPPSVVAECTWPGGKVLLTVDYFRESAEKYRGSVCLRVASPDRWLVVVNVKTAIAHAQEEGVAAAPLLGLMAILKRDLPEQNAINAALRSLVKTSGLEPRGRRVELARVELPGGTIAGGAALAFERCIHAALLKLEFSDRAHLPGRGAPLLDVAKLELTAAAQAALASMVDERSAEDGEDDAVARIRRKVEKAAPDPVDRRAALELLAYAVDNAHDERPGGWVLENRGGALVLQTGRLYAYRLRGGMVALSVIGPISPEVRAALAAKEEDESEAWKAIPGGLWLKFPASKAGVALDLLRDPFDRFVDAAMARMGRRLDPESHLPEIVTYLAEELGRDVPQPAFEAPAQAGEVDDGDDRDADAAPANHTPDPRGRGPIFDKSHRKVQSLLDDVESGAIALPDLQRPFVWTDSKVRDLLDSLFVGYPTGTVVLWQPDAPVEAHALGTGDKASKASALVIDGQQRLTSLFAVIKGREVKDADGEPRTITIAFRPRDGRFDVADAAIRNDPEYLADVGVLWRGGKSLPVLRREIFAGLAARGRVVDQAYQDAVEHNLAAAAAIEKFEFPVIEIRKGEATDEQVADIFVRINNQGTRLGQADFVLTLLSVFHGSLRDKIEKRAATISEESVIGVDAQQLLRAACAVAFERARMSAIYKFLRGVDPDTGDTDPGARARRLAELDAAADACVNTTTWSDYLKRVHHAGFVAASLVAAPSAVANAFAFYVKGQRAQVERHVLDRLISRWVFGTLVTARYSTSSETVFEADLARVRRFGAGDGAKFVSALDEMLESTFTGDYWSRTLVTALETQRGRAPSALAFRAAQIVLGHRALFSDVDLRTLLTPGPSASKSATEQHHLFPKAWLAKKGITDRRAFNQVANLADINWNVNLEIGAKGPADYVPRLRDKLQLDDARWATMCAQHALPVDWATMAYEDFLAARRVRMAHIIRAAYGELGGESDGAAAVPAWFFPGADAVWAQIGAVERALRQVVREVYGAKYGAGAAGRIENALPEHERESLTRALRARPPGAEPLTVVDYLYLKQLPTLLTANDVWADAKARLGNPPDKQRLLAAVDIIAPTRNEIAHIREVSAERLKKVSVACDDVLAMAKR
ncbi:MAG: DUF262 domain-containing protein [Kofleriaceae bacterium]|nr:DUF262 domain-containing protein [Kofleriaceae bacterium]MBP9167231.1 DUF262 domain-containing protein [Kofleriaceae bacterium]MBP9862838.1 DUF262 domain-containing protein [Kofleriaceae bacterium]